MALSAAEVNTLKLAPPVEGVIPAILNRWSSRAYSSQEVSEADLAKIFEATRWTASAYNEQPWRFVVGVRGSETHAKIAASLMGFNQGWAIKAPVLILTMAQTHFTHNGKENPCAMYDLGAATAALTLQATELGMTTRSMAGFDPQAARESLQIPEEFALATVISLGYQAEPEVLEEEQMRAQEASPRKRKPLNELVFTEWGKGAELTW